MFVTTKSTTSPNLNSRMLLPAVSAPSDAALAGSLASFCESSRARLPGTDQVTLLKKKYCGPSPSLVRNPVVRSSSAVFVASGGPASVGPEGAPPRFAATVPFAGAESEGQPGSLPPSTTSDEGLPMSNTAEATSTIEQFPSVFGVHGGLPSSPRPLVSSLASPNCSSGALMISLPGLFLAALASTAQTSIP